MAADCEAPVADTECSVPAIGRCIRCLKAFCPSHQGAERIGSTITFRYVDLCAACDDLAKEPGREAAEEQAARYLLGWGSLRALEALRASTSPKISLCAVKNESVKKGLFGGRTMVETNIRLGEGWLIGKINWTWRNRLDVNETGPWLTAYFDRDAEGNNQRLVRVVRRGSAYEVLVDGLLDQFALYAASDLIRTVAGLD